LLTAHLHLIVFTPTKGHGEGEGATPHPKEKTETTSSCVAPFLCICSWFSCCSSCFSCCYFVFSALVVCAVDAVLNVVVASLAIKKNNKKTSRKTTSGNAEKHKKYKAEIAKTEQQKSREAKKN